MTATAMARPLVTSRRRPTAAVLAASGLLLVALGAVLPWVSLYAGLAPVPGFLLDGGLLSGFAVASAGLLVACARMGGARLLRPVAAVAALAVAGDAAYSAWRIAAFVAAPGPAGALTQPSAGVGASVMAGGGSLLVVAALTVRPTQRALAREDAARLVLSAALLLSGWIHLVLAPSHLAEWAPLGEGFVTAGAAQVALAAWSLVRPSDGSMIAAVAVSAALLAMYAWAVVVGLPVPALAHAAHDAAPGLKFFAGEPVDIAGAITASAEVVAVLVPLWALGCRSDGAGTSTSSSD